jgi:hypothetical protein
MHSNCHALLVSTLYVYSILLDAVSQYHVTPPVKPDNTATELWRLRALTIFSEFFVCSILVLAGNQLQQLPPGVFSSLTSLGSLTCVVICIEIVCVHICV